MDAKKTYAMAGNAEIAALADPRRAQDAAHAAV